jgi:hypothetical protein
MILEWILGKQDLRMWIGFIRSGQEPLAGSLKHGNESLDSKKVRNFLTGSEYY